ncbi:IS5 family transposase [Streptomyces sp. NPDC094149]|uniref:IS5 family transposase n=1 Tax=Streptomyces sp. NPDC094149 TaxID=3155079 RepID=UPI00331E80D6
MAGPGALWERIEPLLPAVERRSRYPGRRRIDDRRVLCGILSVLYTHPVAAPAAGARLRIGDDLLAAAAGLERGRVWERLHELLLGELWAAGMLDFSKAAIDSSHVRAMKGGPATGRSPVDRGKAGSKHHVIVEAHGIPLAVTLTGGNRNDVTQLIPLIQAVPPIRSRSGRPLRRPRRVYADRGYDHDVYRDKVRQLEITPVIARRGAEHGSCLGVHCLVVEGAVALLHWFRRLRIRWEIRDDIHQAFITLGCAIICWHRKTSVSP